MNIAIHGRVLNERAGGPFRYTYNMIKELALLDRVNKYYIILYDEYQFGYNLPDNFCVKICKFRNKVFFDYLYFPLLSYMYKFNISLFPKSTFAPWVSGARLPFFNDIIYFENVGFREFKFFENLHHKLMIPICGKLSFKNLAISEFTMSRMKALLGLDKKKTRIIRLAVEDTFRVINDQGFLDCVRQKYKINRPFYFYAGSLSPRKNMLNVLQAFLKIKDKVDHKIYFTAGDSWRDHAVFDLIQKSGLGDRVVRLGFLSNEELVAMYNLADCYLYPSLYEGFGLPILEAQACGCPVITSCVASCPEVAGDAALIIDPRNTEEIATAMLKIVNDPALRRSLVEKGFENVKKFSWEKFASELIDVFNEVRQKQFNGSSNA